MELEGWVVLVLASWATTGNSTLFHHAQGSPCATSTAGTGSRGSESNRDSKVLEGDGIGSNTSSQACRRAANRRLYRLGASLVLAMVGDS